MTNRRKPSRIRLRPQDRSRTTSRTWRRGRFSRPVAPPPSVTAEGRWSILESRTSLASPDRSYAVRRRYCNLFAGIAWLLPLLQKIGQEPGEFAAGENPLFLVVPFADGLFTWAYLCPRHGSRAARWFRRGPSKATGIPRSSAAIPSRWNGHRALGADGPIRRSTAPLGSVSPTRDGILKGQTVFVDQLLETFGLGARAGVVPRARASRSGAR
jgi:hypothetical protein